MKRNNVIFGVMLALTIAGYIWVAVAPLEPSEKWMNDPRNAEAVERMGRDRAYADSFYRANEVR